MPIIPLIILLVMVSTFSLPVHHSSVNIPQLPPTGITWVTKPLQQVYNLIQSRFIGLIPGNYTEPSSSDYSTMSTIFGFIDTGVSQSDAGSILSASNLATQLKYQLIPMNDSATGNKYYVLMENTTVNRGWGSYLFPAERSPSTTQVVIEAPHPVTDFNSQQIAYTIFTSAYPHVTALLVSGVERTFGPNGQTDMAHRTQRIFDGFTHERLGAQKIIQGSYATAFGAGIVHSEISSIVVYNDTLITKYENSLTRSILNKFGFPAYQIDIKIPIIALGIMSFFF